MWYCNLYLANVYIFTNLYFFNRYTRSLQNLTITSVGQHLNWLISSTNSSHNRKGWAYIDKLCILFTVYNVFILNSFKGGKGLQEILKDHFTPPPPTTNHLNPLYSIFFIVFIIFSKLSNRPYSARVLFSKIIGVIPYPL